MPTIRSTISKLQRVNATLDWLASNPRIAVLAILTLGFDLRVLVMVVTHTWPDTKILEATSVGLSIARGEGFSNPFYYNPTGPTAHVAPVYPYLFAALVKIFGLPLGDLIRQLLSCALSATIYAAMPSFAQLVGLGRRVGVLAGFIGAAAIISSEVEVAGRWEQHLATVILIVALVLCLKHFQTNALSLKNGIVSGLVWGFLFLTSPAFLPVLVALILVFTFKYSSKSRVLYYMGTLAVVALMVVTPWIVRNYRVFGHVFWIRSNAGLEFFISNRPESAVTLTENLRTRAVFWQLHPFMSKSAAKRVSTIGEIEFNRECMAKFKEAVRDDPAAFMKRAMLRAMWMVFPVTPHPVRDGMLIRDLVCCGIAFLGLVGYYLYPRKSSIGALALVVTFFSYQFVYFFLHTSTRYRFPVAWMYCLFCAYALLRFAEKKDGSHDHLLESK